MAWLDDTCDEDLARLSGSIRPMRDVFAEDNE